MVEKVRYTLQKPARLIYASLVKPSAPVGYNAEPKYNGTFGIDDIDFKAIVEIMINGLKKELGSFSGNPNDYYLACQSGATAAKRTLAKADFDVQGKTPDEAFKIKEKATQRAELYKPYAGILTASSKFPVELARLDGGKIVSIGTEEHVLAQAEKDYFYRGAYIAPCVEFQSFRRKKLDDKDGVTAFLKQALFVKGGERLSSGSIDASETFKSYEMYSQTDPTSMTPGFNLDEEIPF